MHDNALKGVDRARVIAAAAKLSPGPVRDLFEGYLPPDPKGRKLGSNPRPATILSLKGDATKGETLFFAKDLKCATCHKVGDRGTAVGPELTAIGKTRSRAELLDSLLQPSARVDPQFAAYLVRTKDEKTATGLLVKRDDRHVVVRDAENKEHSFAAADVDSVRPSRLSLMPDAQMSGLTPQEAADLLEYLTSRK
jgi:putative heme-binding domain-containing protein